MSAFATRTARYGVSARRHNLQASPAYLEWIAQARSYPIEDVAKRLGLDLRREGPKNIVGSCPACGGTDRFGINVRKQIWTCRGCPPPPGKAQLGGDVISLVRLAMNLDFHRAVEWLTERPKPHSSAQISPEQSASFEAERQQREAERQANEKKIQADILKDQHNAARIWRAAIPISGTLAEQYLTQTRKLAIPDSVDDEILRFHPFCAFGTEHHPSLIALIRNDVTNEPTAVQRTALRPDATKIGRMSLGPIKDSAIKLIPDEDVTYGLCIGEGLETTLAAMQLGLSPAWSVLDANNMAAFPVLNAIEALTLLVDHDDAGRKAADQCSQRWREAGREVFRAMSPVAEQDFANLVERAE
jgi:hypothetical protein